MSPDNPSKINSCEKILQLISSRIRSFAGMPAFEILFADVMHILSNIYAVQKCVGMMKTDFRILQLIYSTRLQFVTKHRIQN
jgi:hypothetical protein